MGGKQLFGRLQVAFEPLPQSKQHVQVLSFVHPDVLPGELVAAAVDELKMCGEGGGPIGSFPLSGIKVTVKGGEWNPGGFRRGGVPDCGRGCVCQGSAGGGAGAAWSRSCG